MEYADRIRTCTAILCLLITPVISQRLTTTTAEPNIDIRLTQQESPSEGRVEVFQSDRWGILCDYQLTLPVATVICRQLGYDLALEISHLTYDDDKQNVFSEIYCYGDEKTLAECYTVKAYYDSRCSPGGVRCGNFSEPFDVRLVDGTTPSEGRLEVHHQGIWGSVCADGITLQEANVACQQLGYDLALEVKDPSFYGTGDVGILLNDIDCVGDEKLLSRCRTMDWGSHYCGPSNDVGVRCGNLEAGEMPISLTDSYRDSGNRGNVKVFYNGNWGYICRGTNWDIEEANVACRQLGYEGGARSNYDYHSDYDSDVRFIRAYIHCIGDEMNLAECGLGDQTLTYSCQLDQVYVVCSSSVEGDLSNGKIAGITITCILLVMMLVVIPVIILRCKKPKIPQSPTTNGQQQANGATSNGTNTPGQFIPSATTVMYVNSPIGASQVIMPYGSPSVAYAENGQIMYPQQPVIFQQPVSSPPQNIVSAANVDATNTTATTGLLADTGSATPRKDKISSSDGGAAGTENTYESQETVTHDQVPLV